MCHISDEGHESEVQSILELKRKTQISFKLTQRCEYTTQTIFRKKAALMVNLKKEHTHSQPLGPPSSLAPAGALTLGAWTLGGSLPSTLFHKRSLASQRN